MNKSYKIRKKKNDSFYYFYKMGVLGYDLSFQLNFWTFLLIIVYFVAFAGGYYLIASQVKLVKKEVWNTLDRIKCGVFAFYFANGVSIIVTMMVTFTTGKNYAHTGMFIVVPLLFCLVFIVLYPLFDFIYMALGNPAMTPIQAPFEKLISIFPRKLRVLWAIFLYLLLFPFPIVLMIYYFGISPIIAWISWGLIFPMSIITFYGAKGYIAGLVNSYLQIPTPARSIFLLYDKSKRASKEFFRTPVQRIMTGLMLYLYIWTGYSLYSTLQYINPESTSTGFNTMSYAFTVYIVLFLGIWGYFSRFWGRKIKFKTMDILFAAALIAAVGVNVLTNFIIVNADILQQTFNEWSLTKAINEVWVINSRGIPIGKFRQLAPAAVIEETVLVIAISYYFFEKKRQFMMDSVYAEITKAANAFNPVPLFNQARSSSKRHREHAYYSLRLLYSRLPLKAGYALSDPVFRDPLLDSLCDSNIYAEIIGKEILYSLIKDYPLYTAPLIKDIFNDPNFEKLENVLHVLLVNLYYSSSKHSKLNGETLSYKELLMQPSLFYSLFMESLLDEDNKEGIEEYSRKFLDVFDVQEIFNLVLHPSSIIKLQGIMLYTFYFKYYRLDEKGEQDKKDSVLLSEDKIETLMKLVEDPLTRDWNLVALVLFLLRHAPHAVSEDFYRAYFRSPSLLVRKIAASAIGASVIENLESASVETLLKLISNPNPELSAAALRALAKSDKFSIKETQVPIDPIIEKLLNQEEDVRNAALECVKKIMDEDPSIVPLESLMDEYSTLSREIQLTLLELFSYNPQMANDKMLSLLTKELYSEDSEIKEKASRSLVNIAKGKEDSIVECLLPLKETETFIRQGMISKTLTELAKNNPSVVVPMLVDILEKEEVDDENKLANAVSALKALSGMGKEFAEIIPIKSCLTQWQKIHSNKIKRDLVIIIANVAKFNPHSLKAFIPTIIKQLDESDRTLKLTVAKMIVEVSRKNPSLFPFSTLTKMSQDTDPSIRELAMKAIPYYSKEFPNESISIIVQGLKDEEWNVKSAATESLKLMGDLLKDENILKEVLNLVDYEEKWTKIKAIEIILQAAQGNPSIISISKVIELIENKENQDPSILVPLAKLLGTVAASNLDQAFPSILNLLQHDNEKVREAMIRGLLNLSAHVPINVLVPKLLHYLSDETDILLQESIALALTKIVKYESESIKQRVISLLKIRCEMSQNRVICKCLADLTS